MITGPVTLERERAVFLGRLRSDPVFLLKHIPALLRALFRRIRTAITLRFASRHRGRKVWPHWLDRTPLIPVAGNPGAAFTVCLPTYPASNQPFPEALRGWPAESAPTPMAADLEETFAAHRWKFLLTVAFAGPAVVAAALAECRRWIADNRDTDSWAWEPYSACERIANLLVFLAVTPASRPEPGVMQELLAFVVGSACWIHRHLEYYGPGEEFNHILNNARALVMTGVAADDEAMFGAGITLFRNCLPRLVSPAGVLRERSSHYQLIVLNWVLDAWRFCAARRGESSAETQFLRDSAARMTAAAALLCDVPGPFITIGDVSPDAPPVQSIARLAFLYPDCWPAPAGSLQPVQALDGWFRLSDGEETVVAQFPSGSFPLGYLTHGHCDLTSFVWRHHSREVLADTGRFRYTPDAVSLFQKSASGHNVPLVNGLAPVCETLVANGQWWPLPYARATLEAAVREGSIVLSHTGYARATPVTRHERRISPQPLGIVVTDSFEGQRRAELTFCWQFGEGFHEFESQALAAVGEGARVELDVAGISGRITVESACGEDAIGWASDQYGQKRAALSVRLRAMVDLPCVVSTRFRFVACAE